MRFYPAAPYQEDSSAPSQGTNNNINNNYNNNNNATITTSRDQYTKHVARVDTRQSHPSPNIRTSISHQLLLIKNFYADILKKKLFVQVSKSIEFCTST